MQRAELAARLVEASNAEGAALLKEHSALADVSLAYAIKDICYEAFTIEPARSVKAAAALSLLVNQTSSEEIQAVAEWVAAIAALVQGQMERAIAHLDLAETKLLALGDALAAATTQLSKLIALAMLGRYEEAIDCGLRAREVFLQHDDLLSAGRIENNIGNLYFRRERYTDAEAFQSSARERFLKLNVDQKQLAIINNCLANTHAVLHKFASAESLYEQAEQQAEAAALPVTLAEIESNIGNFALLQGRYDRALDYLERSRRRYASLDMPHQSTIAEQEIADAYLELNLVIEAATIYERIIPKFAELGLRAEQARSLAYLGRAAMVLGRMAEAQTHFKLARDLYEVEGNEVGAAMVALSQAQLDYHEGRIAEAGKTATEVEAPLVVSGSWRRLLLARWLRGESARAQGNLSEAETMLRQTLAEAIHNQQPQIAERVHTSLGLLAASRNDNASAELEFKRAIELTEELRAPLPGEEFRTAFFADKLTPYNELVRSCLADHNRVGEAFTYVERARARALVDAMGERVSMQTGVVNSISDQLNEQFQVQRQELNYLYNQLERPARLSTREVERLRSEVKEREQAISEIVRRLQHRSGRISTSTSSLNLEELQRALGAATALIEFSALDDEVFAFVVTDNGLSVTRRLATEAEVNEELIQLRFQLDALRSGSASMRRHLPDLTRRTRRHLEKLYDFLIRPLEALIVSRRLVIVPQRTLHYLPFQALHDGQNYLIETREVSYAPSALVLQQCLAKAKGSINKGLLLGVADEYTPRVHDEISALAPLFPQALTLLDDEASTSAFLRDAPTADVIHLACHGQFRPDNPLFSSLRLGDGWLTVRDMQQVKLNCELVTLSACETGVNAIAPGEELIGLARGFFAAGAPSLLMSLWTVDDDATAQTMVEFYGQLRATRSPAKALRHAQLEIMKTHPHPFFWAPFVLMGRW